MTEPIFDLVIADLRDRERRGAMEYGRARMEAHDGRDTLTDMYEELLDAAAYAKKLIIERDAMVAAVIEQVQAGKHVSIAEHVIESDEDYARRMGWHTEPQTRSWSRHYGYIMPLKRGGWRWHTCQMPDPCAAGDVPTLRAAVDAYEAQNGKTLAQALAEVGEDEPT